MKLAKVLLGLSFLTITSLSYAELPASIAEKHPELVQDEKELKAEAKADQIAQKPIHKKHTHHKKHKKHTKHHSTHSKHHKKHKKVHPSAQNNNS
ncbi:hypothetical protein LHV13_03220 [Ferrovum sp. PN-J185]|uniref:hypothetical protein n=1 Tax=Ferrovum sp. PN-J185 TaxID=1356306 RepID=UPI000791D322|nr:hypothetical protein [Ferrovum sp. PN-J185]KXW56465.1 hypothetical protein FV185_04140 [Ferrovum sp. PN-J185]MCC6068186.1 hypothetical protein [Ferrovum sp. PN-J185]MDE1891701.1 hypothetical protein [Betaproteobacteria bacterium]MDE2056457.1 hypothetical protein [Betaproteobacteria bacterium]